MRAMGIVPFDGHPDWTYLGPNSIVKDDSGVIFVGMDYSVMRMVPLADGSYEAEWLLPPPCPSKPPGKSSRR